MKQPVCQTGKFSFFMHVCSTPGEWGSHWVLIFTGDRYRRGNFHRGDGPTRSLRCYDPGMAKETPSDAAVHQAELERRIADIRAKAGGELLSAEEYAAALGLDDELAIDVIEQTLDESDQDRKT